MENEDLMNNFNLNINEILNSSDIGNFDNMETKGSKEVMKEINNLKKQISKNLNDISTIDTDLDSRESKFLEEFNQMDKDKKELYKILENEFIINSHLYFESDRNDVIFRNLKSEFMNDDNVRKPKYI